MASPKRARRAGRTETAAARLRGAPRRGRPTAAEAALEGDPRERLLDVAEPLFAEHGYNGTSVRVVASAAGVNQALIAYYFGSKEGLYLSVFERRGRPLMVERSHLLAEARGRAGRAAVPLRALIHAFVYPPLRMAIADGPGGRAFVKLQARLHNEPKALEEKLRKLLYDDVTLAFAREFRRALPTLPEKTVLWRLTCLMGVYIYAASHTGRLELISKGRATTRDFDAALAQIVAFAEAGFAAPPPPQPAGRRAVR